MNLCVHENLIKPVGSKQSCLSGNNKKTTTTKSYLKHHYLNKMARRPGCTAGCCLFFLSSVCAAENVSCAVVAKQVEDVFLERANKIKAAAAAETQMTHVSTLI